MKTKSIIYGLFFLLLGTSVKAADNKVGINLYESGMLGEAKVFFLNNLKQLQDEALRAEACYYLGECYLETGVPDSAGIYYQEGLTLKPDYPYNLIGLAGLKLSNDVKGAEEQFKEAITTKGYKKDAGVQLAIAKAYMNAKDMVKAREHVNQAKEFDSKSGLPYLVEGDILVAEGKVGDACAKYEMATYFSPDCVGAYLKQAQLYMTTNRSLSLEKLNKVSELFPEFGGTYRSLGELHEMAGNSKAAAENYSKFIRSGYYDSENLLRYAGILYYDKQYEEMLPVLQSVLKEKPENLVAKRLYAYCLSKQEDREKCLEAIKHFIESTPEENQICQDYLCYAEQLTASKAYGEAITYYKKALTSDCKRQELLRDIADLFVKDHELDSAVVYYNQYMDFVQEPAAEDLLKLGRCYYNMACQDSVPEMQKDDLVKADTLFGALSVQVPNSYVSYFWRARVNSMLDPETTQGLAKPYYEKVIEIALAQPERYKRELIESYKYLGYYHYVIADGITTKNNGNPDPAKQEYGEAKAFFSKVLTLDNKDEVALKALESIKL
ncbi:hypothetical protein [Odoribacter sp. AF15-53]|uniref:tetratricopeptide repeat protein n=1 Tax=Odoribacter sp. AF15-53 TaxID=2292236 RepID=UPI000E4A9948|nr:hypothetical protein [Odoribacter sp. AF15-53]RHR82605.1 hypothetical protein DWW52_01675 [Odoribacter sp. AF15-53]